MSSVNGKVFVRTAFNYDMNAASMACSLDCSADPSMTKQEFKEECDINTIVERFGLTGAMPESVVSPLTGDFTEVTDYRSALHLIMEADAAFMEIPAAVRERFGNDAGRFVAFVSDPANAAACKEMGLARVERPVEPLLVRMVPDPLAAAVPPILGAGEPPKAAT